MSSNATTQTKDDDMAGSTKQFTMNEVNLVSWFNGQIGVIESQTGQKVEKLTLSVDRTTSDDISIQLQLAAAVPVVVE